PVERQCYVNSGACPAGEQAGCSHPSFPAPRGGGQTQHRALGSKPVCFPFVSRVSGARLRPAPVLSRWPPPHREHGGREESPLAPTAASLSDFKGSPSIVCACGQWP
ncbi:mCG145234, partial [Mus musculus]